MITDIAVSYSAAVIDFIFLIFMRTDEKNFCSIYFFTKNIQLLFKAVVLFSKFHLHLKEHSSLTRIKKVYSIKTTETSIWELSVI